MPVALPLAIVGAGIGGAAIAGSAAKSAANTQAQAANQATNAQEQMFQQTQQNLAPFITGGTTAQTALQQLLGVAPGQSTTAPTAGGANYAAYVQNNPDLLAYWNAHPELQQQYGSMANWGQYHYQNAGQGEGRQLPTYTQADVDNYVSPQEQALQNLPGYQFTRDQGIASINRALGSQGLTGAQAKGIARFVTGLADSTYNSQVTNLQNATNTGESAAAGQGSIGAQTGGNIANTITGAGAAQAAGTVGAANAANSALSSIPNALLLNKLFGGSSGSTGGIYTDPASTIPVTGNSLVNSMAGSW